MTMITFVGSGVQLNRGGKLRMEVSLYAFQIVDPSDCITYLKLCFKRHLFCGVYFWECRFSKSLGFLPGCRIGSLGYIKAERNIKEII